MKIVLLLSILSMMPLSAMDKIKGHCPLPRIPSDNDLMRYYRARNRKMDSVQKEQINVSVHQNNEKLAKGYTSNYEETTYK